MLLKTFLDERPAVTLFTRPRRFGKTLQLNDKKYDCDMRAQGVKIIYKYGVAFCGKKVSVEAE